MGWVIIIGRILYGMFVSEEDAREVQRRVGGELMTSEQYADYAAERNRTKRYGSPRVMKATTKNERYD